ncbi:hypothetical protein Pcinc_041720, partial [Petrolisthes cinctipes]
MEAGREMWKGGREMSEGWNLGGREGCKEEDVEGKEGMKQGRRCVREGGIQRSGRDTKGIGNQQQQPR